MQCAANKADGLSFRDGNKPYAVLSTAAGRSIMPTRFVLTIPLLLVSTCFGSGAIAASTQGNCPGGSMSATQYSTGSGTASGQAFRPDGLTAAHNKLPFGTRVKLTNPHTGASTIVTINDRGPLTRGRDIDLSRGAARAIGLTSVGTICAEILRGELSRSD